MKNNVSKFTECANCGACYNSCPTNAITVNANGFFYKLKIDDDKCMNCGKCVSVCPVNTCEAHQNLISAIGGHSKNSQTVKISSSGGAFYTVADYIISKGGKVFGAAFSDDNRTVEIKSTDEVPFEKLLRSKYVESIPGDSFKKVKKALENQIEVLFCGCPCQVAGLKRFLGKEYENLITCDFSCGGLPSNKIYKDYLNQLENKYISKASSLNFRPKTYGWETHGIQINFQNDKKYNSLAILDPFYNLFIYKHYSVRDNCLTCKFADNHYADIILADFWLHNRLSNLEKGDGLSLIISNSAKGEKILNSVIKENFVYEQINIEKAAYNMKKPEFTSDFLQNREAFFEKYRANGFSCIYEFLPKGVKKYKVLLKTFIKRFIKR